MSRDHRTNQNSIPFRSQLTSSLPNSTLYLCTPRTSLYSHVSQMRSFIRETSIWKSETPWSIFTGKIFFWLDEEIKISTLLSTHILRMKTGMLGSNTLRRVLLSKLSKTVRVVRNHMLQVSMPISFSLRRSIRTQPSTMPRAPRPLKKCHSDTSRRICMSA